MPGTTSALQLAMQALLGLVTGLLPTLLIALASGMSVPGVPLLAVPLLMAAYVSFLALVFIATACLLSSIQRSLSMGIALGLLITTALYVTVLYRVGERFS